MILQTLDSFLTAERALGARGPWVVAFSGGGDSTALAAGLAELAPRQGVDLHLFHVDHGLDAGSGERAAGAAAIAAELGLPFTSERHPVPEPAQRREGSEAAARRVRYAALEVFRERIGADRILTAHHRNDQIETLLLRIAAGSGLAGLQGIHRRRGAILRPLLDLDRSVLEAFVAAKGIVPLADPTNLDLAIERNRIRHRLWPHLEREEPGLGSALAAVAQAAERARKTLDGRLRRLLVREHDDAHPCLEVGALPPSTAGEPELASALAAASGAAARARTALGQCFEKLLAKEGRGLQPRLEIAAILPLPEPLPFFALGLLERLEGRERPGSTRSKRELLRQLSAEVRVPGGLAGGRFAGTPRLALAAGDGLFWQASGGFLWLAPLPAAVPAFSYILELPGEVEIPELHGRIRLSREPLAPWMRIGERRRAAIAIPSRSPGADPVRVEIRNRRPGDRIRSLGAPGMRRLKELLIDHKVPSVERDRIPLLLIDGAIAWVPGITVADRFRLQDESDAWVVEWIDNPKRDFRRMTIEAGPADGREESRT